MGIALRSGGARNSALPASGGSITLPLTTLLDDCIVIWACCSGTSNITVTDTGGSLTWTEAFSSAATDAPKLVCWVGYAATAGQTTIKITYSGSTGSYSLGMFTGVATSGPVVSDAGTGWAGAETGMTTSSASYTSGELVLAGIGFEAVSTLTWSATTWSNGDATTSLGANVTTNERVTAADFVVPSTGTSTTATFGWTPSETGGNYGIVVVAPASSGYSDTGTGAISFAGSGTATVIVSDTGTGAIHFAGSGTALVIEPDTGTGHITFQGSGTGLVKVPDSGTGHVTFHGSGTSLLKIPDTGLGHVTFAGSGTPLVKVPATGTGAIAFHGSGTASAGGQAVPGYLIPNDLSAWATLIDIAPRAVLADLSSYAELSDLSSYVETKDVAPYVVCSDFT